MSSTDLTDQLDESTLVDAPGQRIAASPARRFLLGQTAVDFWGRRRIASVLSLVLVVLSVVSLFTRGLNTSIEFDGGVVYDVPTSATFDVDAARDALSEAGISGSEAQVELRRSVRGDDVVKIQVAERSLSDQAALQSALASAAGVAVDDVSMNAVSSSWGSEITRKTIIALIVLVVLLTLVIWVRFEWRMALSIFASLVHNLVIGAGIYSLFGFQVGPATVIAFLAVMAYSLYDSMVVFDRVRENERRVIASGLTAEDLVNVSANKVLLRSLLAAAVIALPALSLLVVGSFAFGVPTLREYALALFLGSVLAAYSTLFIATPLVGWLKGAGLAGHQQLTGEDLRHVVVRGLGAVPVRSGRRRGRGARASTEGSTERTTGESGDTARSPRSSSLHQTPEQLLQHAPRPRKKKRH